MNEIRELRAKVLLGVIANSGCAAHIIQKNTPWLANISQEGVDRLIHDLEKRGFVETITGARNLRYAPTEKAIALIEKLCVPIIIPLI